MSNSTKRLGLLGGLALVCAFLLLVPEPNKMDKEDNKLGYEQYLSQEEKQETEVESTQLTSIEQARTLRNEWQAGERGSEFILIDAWMKAVVEDPEVFDEASELFNSLLTVDARSAVYLRVMVAYVDQMQIHHAAVDQYLNAIDAWLKVQRNDPGMDQISSQDIDLAFYAFMQAWKASGHDERLVQKAVDFEGYYSYAIAEEHGFDHEIRYTAEYLERLRLSNVGNPFESKMLVERLEHLLWLAELRSDEVKARKWKVHLDDYHASVQED